MLLNSENIGQHVLMRHKSNGEIYTGLIVDGDFKYAIIKMDEEAGFLINNPEREIDSRYDGDWIFVEVKPDISVADNGRFQH